MSLDLSPSPGASSLSTRIWRQARTETLLLLRNGEQLLLALVIPVGLLVAIRLFGDRLGLSMQAGGASAVALATWSSGFTALAISTGFERRYGVLERLASTPLTRTGLIMGKTAATLLTTTLQGTILLLIAALLGFRPDTTHPVTTITAVLGCVVAMTAFVAWALALAGSLRAEITLGLANLLHLVGLAAGLVTPVAAFWPGLRPVVTALPAAALGELTRAGFGGVPGVAPWICLLILLGWAIAGVLVARKVFRWMS